MRNSIRQMCRTPFKLLLLILLTAGCALLLSLGTRLWLETGKQLRQAEETFTTIGMVQQREDAAKISKFWDAGLGIYSYGNSSVYDQILEESILDFEGVQYLAGPEKRPFYGAYLPDFALEKDVQTQLTGEFLAEISPVEDCVPSEPVQVKIDRVLYGDADGSSKCWFCDHNNPNPRPMEKGKTYLAYLHPKSSNHTDRGEVIIECVPQITSFGSTQCDRQGNKVRGSFADSEKPEQLWYEEMLEEVTEDFYTSGRGVYWQNYIEAKKKYDKTVHVLPASCLELLPSFHEKEAVVTEGNPISQEEFDAGDEVCMIPQEFAQRNRLRVGDRISLPLYFADYGNAPGASGQLLGLLNAQGEVYQTFWEAEYRIVGIYQYTPFMEKEDSAKDLSKDIILIPAGSVRASDENNILQYGPMLRGTASFQILNGTIAEFQEAFQKTEYANFLEIQFDDNGYEQVRKELEKVRQTALLLCSTGLLASGAVVFLLVYFFVIKQKRRTSIERSLGMSKKQCRGSLLYGIVLFTFAAAVGGSLLSGSIYTQTKESLQKENSQEFSRKYSTWSVGETGEEELQTEENTPISYPVFSMTAVPVFLVLLMAGLSWSFLEKNLNAPPMEVLTVRE